MLINIPHCPGQPSCPVTKSNSAPLGKSAKTENFSLKTCSIRDLGTCVFRTLKELMGGGAVRGNQACWAVPTSVTPDVPSGCQLHLRLRG